MGNLYAAATITHPKATADACILLWMGGGMAAPETFDPKAYQPFVKDTPISQRSQSTTASTATSLAEHRS
jgi:Protein of unknown function (DUF1501)